MKALLFVLLVIAVWTGGLFLFAARVIHSTPAPEPPASDGIVVLTGASSLRIEAAVELLEQGLAERLLISGVNPEATREEVRRATSTAGRAFDCCVDLGFQAETTHGNGQETAAWARYHHYRSLIVVTADYHMPRALLELHSAMPRTVLHPYPVATATLDARDWLKRPDLTRRMILEYCKYLAVLGRGWIYGLYHLARGALHHAPASAPPAASPA